MTSASGGKGAFRVGGVVLAAGASRRAGSCKALATLDGEPLVRLAVDTLRAGGCDEVTVVVGPPHGDTVAAAVLHAVVAENPTPERGMLSSLKRALRRALVSGHDAVVVSLVDHPRVRPETVAALLEAWRAGSAQAVTPCYGGRGGHPYLVDRSLFGPLLGASDERGPRPVLREAERLRIEVDDPAVLDDLDTARALDDAGAVRPV